MRVLINHDFSYEVEHLIKNFIKDKIEYISEHTSEIYFKNIITKNNNRAIIETEIINSGKYKKHFEEVILSEDKHESKRQLKRANARMIYDLLVEYTGKENEWGTLVGVRPVKLVHKYLDIHELTPYDTNDIYLYIRKELKKEHRISDKKIDLLLNIARRERKFIFLDNDLDKLSIYICIPFCTTRCLYCSFPSNDLKKKGKYLDVYMECLLREIDEAFINIKKNKRVVDCIYIGGGTPSILSAEQFEVLLSKLNNYVNLELLLEFTVEAGRPDTITKEKLKILKKYFVDRICINPQTMNQRSLDLIGRSHSVSDIIDTYNLAKSFNFKSINMDLILGLPDEDLSDVRRTLEEIIKLNPENITIHTLAIKTSSRLKEHLKEYNMTLEELVKQMLSLSEKFMKDNGYFPYYMYRQKNMVGNFENVGYAKEGFESLYNMRIIEEKHDILALGAGAVSKKCFASEDRFERIANVKGIEDYIERIDDVIAKEKTFFET